MNSHVLLPEQNPVANTSTIASASVHLESEGIEVRLELRSAEGTEPRKLHLKGQQARNVLRWLRTHGEFFRGRDRCPKPAGECSAWGSRMRSVFPAGLVVTVGDPI